MEGGYERFPMNVSYVTYLITYICLAMALPVNAEGEEATNTKETRGVGLINGITLEAPPREVDDQWAKEIKGVHGNWVAIVPYAMCRFW